MKHILVTGLPGVGKTTLIRKLVERLKAYQPVGFFTQEIREQGVRKGFVLVTLDGDQQILSHIDHRGPYRVGRYGVDVKGLEQILTELNLLHRPSSLVIIDEIGKMECLSDRFVKEMQALLDSSKTVIATVALRGEGFLASVKKRSDCRVEAVTVGNRDDIADVLQVEVIRLMKNPKVFA